MGVKMKLGLGIASLILGIALLGGTYAFFFDEENYTSQIKAGKLDLAPGASDVVTFQINNLAPGDLKENPINLTNAGTMDISKVLLNITFTSNDSATNESIVLTGGQLIDDLWITITDLSDNIIYPEKSLKSLTNPENIDIDLGGILIGGNKPLKIKFNYKDTGINQNHQQEDSVNITFKFTAKQPTN